MLNALYKNCIFSSQERLETHALVEGELSDHHLRWQGGKVDTRMYKFHAQKISLYSLKYGDAVDIYPEVYKDFFLVHFSLSGGIEIEADGCRRAIPQGRAIISSPRRNINLHWTNACEQLILRIPHHLLDNAAKRLGPGHSEMLRDLDPGLLLAGAAMGAVVFLLARHAGVWLAGPLDQRMLWLGLIIGAGVVVYVVMLLILGLRPRHLRR